MKYFILLNFIFFTLQLNLDENKDYDIVDQEEEEES